MGDFPGDDLSVEPLPAAAPAVGRSLWMLQAARARTLRLLEEAPPALLRARLDWRPSPDADSIAALLYHLAAIEASWLYEDVLEQSLPPEIEALFPYDVRNAQGMLTNVAGMPLEAHLERLETCRAALLEVYRAMSPEEFTRPRRLERYTVTPEWVIFHLLHHEAQHSGQIAERLATPARPIA